MGAMPGPMAGPRGPAILGFIPGGPVDTETLDREHHLTMVIVNNIINILVAQSIFTVTGAFPKKYLNITLFFFLALKAVLGKFCQVWQNTLNNFEYPLLKGVWIYMENRLQCLHLP